MSDMELDQMRDAELEHRRSVALAEVIYVSPMTCRMMTPKDREAVQNDRLAATRPQETNKAAADAARQRILAELAEMCARPRAAPDWVEPTEEQEKLAEDTGGFRSAAASNHARNKPALLDLAA
jgi:hypothetical protein